MTNESFTVTGLCKISVPGDLLILIQSKIMGPLPLMVAAVLVKKFMRPPVEFMDPLFTKFPFIINVPPD
jgi:hypothetical protein